MIMLSEVIAQLDHDDCWGGFRKAQVPTGDDAA